MNTFVWVLWVLVQPVDAMDVVKQVDALQKTHQDVHAHMMMEQASRTGTVLYALDVYRKSTDAQWVLLFSQPSTEKGKGYMRLQDHILLYDPLIGKWERRTHREHMAGTHSVRSDFDETHWQEEYTPSVVGEEQLGVYHTVKLMLKPKEGADVAYPLSYVWIDTHTFHVLKRQDMGSSGALMRTLYYPQWGEVWSGAKKSMVHYPKEIRIFDALEPHRQTSVVIDSFVVAPVAATVFTKPWMESQSR
jgi:hypothetical protein